MLKNKSLSEGKKKHKHLFKKFSDEVIEIKTAESMNRMFGIDVSKEFGNEVIKERKTIYKCKCGKTMAFKYQYGICR